MLLWEGGGACQCLRRLAPTKKNASHDHTRAQLSKSLCGPSSDTVCPSHVADLCRQQTVSSISILHSPEIRLLICGPWAPRAAGSLPAHSDKQLWNESPPPSPSWARCAVGAPLWHSSSGAALGLPWLPWLLPRDPLDPAVPSERLLFSPCVFFQGFFTPYYAFHLYYLYYLGADCYGVTGRGTHAALAQV